MQEIQQELSMRRPALEEDRVHAASLLEVPGFSGKEIAHFAFCDFNGLDAGVGDDQNLRVRWDGEEEHGGHGKANEDELFHGDVLLSLG
jgi:hypothetical protein